MQRFTQLYLELDQTTRTNDKVAALVNYFSTAPSVDAAWGLSFLLGKRPPRRVNATQLRTWAAEISHIPDWLLSECYEMVGDLSETLALILPKAHTILAIGLNDLVQTRLLPLKNLPVDQQRTMIVQTWSELAESERFVWHKLILGNFRVGVVRGLVARALAQLAAISSQAMEHRLLGRWQPSASDFENLLAPHSEQRDPGQPYPFYLASPLEVAPQTLGTVTDWQIEWKWDGIRAQLIRRGGTVLIWTRGEELVTDRYPEIAAAGLQIPDGTVLDGELLAWRDQRALPFQILQQRIGRRTVSPKLLRDAPVAFMAYDILERMQRDIRSLSLDQRRVELAETLAMTSASEPSAAMPTVATSPLSSVLLLSPIFPSDSWDAIEIARTKARDQLCEGVMLKRRTAPYGVGRTRGHWWKWKSTPLTIDAVLVAAQPGHGKRANLYTDYTFAVWDDGNLVTVAKAYSGLTDVEILQVDKFVRENIRDRFGPVRSVNAQLVFELHFEGVQLSNRHKSGVAVRFPRIARIRTDKPVAEADSLTQLKALAGKTWPLTLASTEKVETADNLHGPQLETNVLHGTTVRRRKAKQSKLTTSTQSTERQLWLFEMD